MTPALSRRLGDAFNASPPSATDRQRVVGAAGSADKFSDLPDDIQQLVEGMENAPADT